MSRKKPAIQRGACRCCWQNMADHPHHPWPKSQGGEDEGTVNVCLDCHSLYHSIVGQRLAKTATQRARNHSTWYLKMKASVDLMGGRDCDPNIMAPKFVLDEWSDYCTQVKPRMSIIVKDRSGGCLERHGKVEGMREVRDHLRHLGRED